MRFFGLIAGFRFRSCVVPQLRNAHSRFKLALTACRAQLLGKRTEARVTLAWCHRPWYRCWFVIFPTPALA